MRGVFYFAVICQANACLDLLVRSFNEVFSPIIETGKGRIQKPHNVDDLTNLYKTDEYGNLVPRLEYFHNVRAKKNLMAKNSESVVGCETTISPDDSTRESEEEIVTSSYDENGSRKRSRYRYYTPGRRPLVDFLIKLIESFQLTATSKFITSRPRYENSQLHYMPDTYYDVY